MCTFRRELSHEYWYLLAKIGFVRAEQEPCKVCPVRSPRTDLPGEILHNFRCFCQHGFRKNMVNSFAPPPRTPIAAAKCSNFRIGNIRDASILCEIRSQPGKFCRKVTAPACAWSRPPAVSVDIPIYVVIGWSMNSMLISQRACAFVN